MDRKEEISRLERNVSSDVVDQFNRIVETCKVVGGVGFAVTSFLATYYDTNPEVYDKIQFSFLVAMLGGITGLTLGYCVGRIIASSYLQRKYPRKAGYIQDWEKATRGLFK